MPFVTNIMHFVCEFKSAPIISFISSGLYTCINEFGFLKWYVEILNPSNSKNVYTRLVSD